MQPRTPAPPVLRRGRGDTSRSAAPATALLLALVVLTSAMHAVSSALVRPMFQVSDEISYFSAVQVTAADAARDEDRARLMPGGGPVHPVVSGKNAFRRAAAAVYAATARRFSPPDAAVLTRIVFSVCHLAVALATWCLARRLYPRHLEVAFVATQLVAWQPVLTAFDASITPDAFANAASAWALVAVVASLTGTARLAWLLVATGLATVAFAMKDTAICVFAGVAVAGVDWLRARIRHRQAFAFTAIAGVASLVVLVWLIGSRFIPAVRDNLEVIERHPIAIVRAVGIAFESIAPMFQSFWALYGNFGGHDIFVSRAWVGAIAALCATAAWGWLRSAAVDDADRPSSVTWGALWATFAVAMMLHPLRVVVFGSIDDPQGRWLFPAVAPLLVALAVGLGRACRSARGTAALGAFAAVAIGVLPLLVVVIPFFYVDGLQTVDTRHLFLRGTYGLAGEPARALALVGPVAEGLVRARLWSVVIVVVAAVVTIAAGVSTSLWRPAPCRHPPSS